MTTLRLKARIVESNDKQFVGRIIIGAKNNKCASLVHLHFTPVYERFILVWC